MNLHPLLYLASLNGYKIIGFDLVLKASTPQHLINVPIKPQRTLIKKITTIKGSSLITF